MTTTIAPLDAANKWAEAFDDMWDMADPFFQAINYSEAEALADVLASAERADLAVKMVELWAEHDPEMRHEWRDDWAERIAMYRTMPGSW